MSGKKEEEKIHCDCYVEASQAENACPPIRNVTHPLRYYEFSQDEMKALEECDKESFYRRCLPFSTLFASLTAAAIKLGFLRRNPHFGAVPKLLVAIFLGYVAGRVQYAEECEAHLRELPEQSPLGKLMRRYYAEKHPPPKK
ncbi:OCIA domain-containing protein 1-like [Plodia interpunctella]|uniref:OCIA domain-containing protein 1-like n=1 Tax=Plodia interpunctella TaxID=58824 RepID=UPI0023675B70|nr:OCIA domain-containing protein 1-like [Plodia interpunctella]